MSLSPWDLSGNISFEFGSTRPRRASYLYATRIARRRNASYRHATKSEHSSGEVSGWDDFEELADFVPGSSGLGAVNGGGGGPPARRARKDRSATKQPCERVELAEVQLPSKLLHLPRFHNRQIPTIEVSDVSDTLSTDVVTSSAAVEPLPDVAVCEAPNAVNGRKVGARGQRAAPASPARRTADGDKAVASHSKWMYYKNLVVLTVAFVLVFSAFRSIQTLQSSLNAANRLGVITMATVHMSMFLTCIFAPAIIDKVATKWMIVVGLSFYLLWVSANLYPSFYTLMPTSLAAGLGQSLAWGAQVVYMQRLASDYAHTSRQMSHYEMYKFNGVFLAAFQTSHIWGNLVSSLMLAGVGRGDGRPTTDRADCGGYDRCEPISLLVHSTGNGSAIAPNGSVDAQKAIVKMIATYMVLASFGFLLILFFLDKIGTKSKISKTCLQTARDNIRQLVHHRQLRLLIPMLIFNGFEQGFIYADYNKSFISCTIGVEYVGYNMITLGLTNSLFSIVVGVLSRHVPREAIIGVGSIMHIGLMVFLLVWIPDRAVRSVFFAISALWGVCDAIWQTQCNYLVSLSCTDDEHDTAFQNFRMLQGFGAAMVFLLGTFCCVAVKLYIIIVLLVLSVLFYVVVEYNIRRVEQPECFDD